MHQWLICCSVFLGAYIINMTYISVLLHRGMTHGSVRLSWFLDRLVRHTGIWMTGMDPVSWCCMHRMHHEHSDQEHDPHSPVRYGILGVFKAQYDNYNQTAAAIIAENPDYIRFIEDIPYRIHWIKRYNVWFLPYLLHAAVGTLLGMAFQNWLVGACYWAGMLSHPIQGWMVNSFGHAVGYRNFKTDDSSRNNTFVAWTALGEGFQNNHHAHPASAKFAYRWFEIDFGWIVCWTLEKIGLLKVNRDLLIRNSARTSPTAV